MIQWNKPGFGLIIHQSHCFEILCVGGGCGGLQLDQNLD
jgi:hypothetical protein